MLPDIWAGNFFINSLILPRTPSDWRKLWPGSFINFAEFSSATTKHNRSTIVLRLPSNFKSTFGGQEKIKFSAHHTCYCVSRRGREAHFEACPNWLSTSKLNRAVWRGAHEIGHEGKSGSKWRFARKFENFHAQTMWRVELWARALI